MRLGRSVSIVLASAAVAASALSAVPAQAVAGGFRARGTVVTVDAKHHLITLKLRVGCQGPTGPGCVTRTVVAHVAASAKLTVDGKASSLAAAPLYDAVVVLGTHPSAKAPYVVTRLAFLSSSVVTTKTQVIKVDPAKRSVEVLMAKVCPKPNACIEFTSDHEYADFTARWSHHKVVATGAAAFVPGQAVTLYLLGDVVVDVVPA